MWCVRTYLANNSTLMRSITPMDRTLIEVPVVVLTTTIDDQDN
jgi:hypothetical protein